MDEPGRENESEEDFSRDQGARESTSLDFSFTFLCCAIGLLAAVMGVVATIVTAAQSTVDKTPKNLLIRPRIMVAIAGATAVWGQNQQQRVKVSSIESVRLIAARPSEDESFQIDNRHNSLPYNYSSATLDAKRMVAYGVPYQEQFGMEVVVDYWLPQRIWDQIQILSEQYKKIDGTSGNLLDGYNYFSALRQLGPVDKFEIEGKRIQELPIENSGLDEVFMAYFRDGYQETANLRYRELPSEGVMLNSPHIHSAPPGFLAIKPERFLKHIALAKKVESPNRRPFVEISRGNEVIGIGIRECFECRKAGRNSFPLPFLSHGFPIVIVGTGEGNSDSLIFPISYGIPHLSEGPGLHWLAIKDEIGERRYMANIAAEEIFQGQLVFQYQFELKVDYQADKLIQDLRILDGFFSTKR